MTAVLVVGICGAQLTGRKQVSLLIVTMALKVEPSTRKGVNYEIFVC
nr:MAG TPA: hypothetical protein [Caudoviricetes sp.]DAJ00546.1 MAG TPA: hypothetical protein [Caudoviricetes sp.]